MPQIEEIKSEQVENSEQPVAVTPAGPGKGRMTPLAVAMWKRLRDKHRWAGNAEMSLILHLNRIAKMVTGEMEARAGSNLPQIRILFEALATEGVSQSTLHKQYQIDPGAITRTVQTMEREGLVTRKVDEGDNRLMRVFITEKGRQFAEGLPAIMSEFERAVTADLTENEVMVLHTVLEKIENRLLKLAEPALAPKL